MASNSPQSTKPLMISIEENSKTYQDLSVGDIGPPTSDADKVVEQGKEEPLFGTDTSSEDHTLPTGAAYHVDWVFGTGSNTNVANHRNWFKQYKSFAPVQMGGFNIVGAGTVELPVVTNKGISTLTLSNVVHATNAICNIWNAPDGMAWMITPNRDQDCELYLDATGDHWAIIDHPHLFRLRLAGQTREQTSLSPYMSYMIAARLLPEEKWILESLMQGAESVS
ncbi:hypothetical protein TWF696_001162 [Orbilia brochopaga]|uniref:Retrovirus-related Pol polyprotein from transposon TNT 1-94-like beta-barrel domain-containing protein n=1 Tax=Orbilia brochopaga TaxID=3140254 RepID=A0AAV9VER5_9PEZI